MLKLLCGCTTLGNWAGPVVAIAGGSDVDAGSENESDGFESAAGAADCGCVEVPADAETNPDGPGIITGVELESNETVGAGILLATDVIIGTAESPSLWFGDC